MGAMLGGLLPEKYNGEKDDQVEIGVTITDNSFYLNFGLPSVSMPAKYEEILTGYLEKILKREIPLLCETFSSFKRQNRTDK